MILPLEGTSIIDLSRFMPGQYCTMLLSEMGADVIKIEAPGSHELVFKTIHGQEPTPEMQQKWLAVNTLDRGKKNLVLDLKAEKARDIFLRLVEKSDVVMEGHRPGVMKRLGIDYETAKGINPRIIYCSLTGYGQDGPYHTMPARDLTCLAMSGILSVLNEGGGVPIVPGVKIADLAGAMYSTIGILLALLARDKTDLGQYVDVAMADGAVSWLTPPLMRYFETGNMPDKDEIYLSGKRPGYNVYKTRDGKYISIAIREPWFWEKLCQKLGRQDLLPYQNPDDDKVEEVISTFRSIFLAKTRDEWCEELRDVGVARVNQLNELASDPQIVHREMLIDVETNMGKVKQTGYPVKLSDTPARFKGQASSIGQHTNEILLSLGYSEGDIAELRKVGVIE